MKQENVKGKNHNPTGVGPNAENADEHQFASPGPLDLRGVNSVDSLVRALGKTASTGRQLGEAADVLEAMARDQDCFVVMTLAGARTVAQQGLLIAELIDRGIVNALVSTGALMAHGLFQATGRLGLSYSSENSASQYLQEYENGGPEQRSSGAEEVLAQILESWDHNEVICSYKLNHLIGQYLARNSGANSVSSSSSKDQHIKDQHTKDHRGILKSAYEKGVPVFVPAFTDSELGLDFALNNRLRESTGRHKLRYDPFEDLDHFAATLLRQKRLGILTIGGGVPRSWSQQFAPFIALRHQRLGENVPLKRYHYGVRISTEQSSWFALPSNSHNETTPGEKFTPSAEGGRFGEVFVDAMVGLPLIVAAVLQRLDTTHSSRNKIDAVKSARNMAKSPKVPEQKHKRSLVRR